MGERVFDGLKVIDCASFIAGPAAATVMSDFGAEVFKIEPAGAGDPYRRRATPPIGPGLKSNPGFELDGRNKKSLALDLRRPAGQAALRRLVGGADVFITNYPPPVRRRLGITHEELAPLNERLIYASFSGYGGRGDEAEKPGFDATAWWARSGMMHLVRAGEAPPVRSLPGMGDHPSAMAVYGAIVTALYRRERTGEGSYVGSSLLANGLWANGCSVQAQLCGERIQPQPVREALRFPLRNHYRCRDGRWLLFSIVADEHRWANFKTAVGRDALDAPQFATAALREANARELTALLDEIFASRDAAEWRRRLDAVGLVFGSVAEMDDIAHDEQIRANGMLVPVAGQDLLTVDSPFWVAGEDKVPPRRAPTSGEHTDEVLATAGLSAEEIQELRAAGVVA